MRILLDVLLFVAGAGLLLAGILHLVIFLMRHISNHPPAIERFRLLQGRGKVMDAVKTAAYSMTILWMPRSEEEVLWNKEALKRDCEMTKALEEVAYNFPEEFNQLLREMMEALQERHLLLNGWSLEKIASDAHYRLHWKELADKRIQFDCRLLQFAKKPHFLRRVI